MTGARSTKWPQRGACRHDERSRVLLPRMRNGFSVKPEGGHRLLCGDSTIATDVERVLGGISRT